MKICAIICEFNPFHNGHKYLLDTAKNLSGCDAVICIMSGSFTQRGEMCILDKYTRARHAVLGGADCVIQLPVPFAVAPAEIFAKGAIKILSQIPEVSVLAFGSESGSAQEFINAAEILVNETDLFKKIINERLADGDSFIKSYAAAFSSCCGNEELVSNPNNILGLEYTKAILRANVKIQILPVRRVGSGYNDCELMKNFSSASAIRQNLTSEKVKDNVPEFVYSDLKDLQSISNFEELLRTCLFKAKACDLKRIYGCGEGLENKLKSLENKRFECIIEQATTKRYSSSRIRRILLANALELYQDETEIFLKDDLYIKTLAVKKDRADEILSALSKSCYPVITGTNGSNLKDSALKCFEKDCYEYSLFNHLTYSKVKDYPIFI